MFNSFIAPTTSLFVVLKDGVPSELVGLESNFEDSLVFILDILLSCSIFFCFIDVISDVLVLILLVREVISDSFLEDLV